MNTFIKNRSFRYITLSDWFSVLGDSIFYLAFISFAAGLQNSNLAITLVTISETLPDAFSFVGGYFSDRTKRKYKADILCAFMRAMLYFCVCLLFLKAENSVILITVIVINLFSDCIGNYSDCLRFPEIYAVVDEEEFESSNGFSSGIYYIINVVGKFVGGFILVLVSNSYAKVAFINALSFIICGLLLIVVKKEVNQKMIKCEKENYDETESSISIVSELKIIFSNASLMPLLVTFTMLNALIASTSSIMYITLANNSGISQEKYTIYLSIIEGVSIAGVILGNLLSNSLFKGRSLKFLCIIEYIFVFFTLISLIIGNIYFIVLCFFILYFFEGAISIKFTTFIFNSGKYDNLGLSTGIINTIITICVPALWIVISLIGNISSFNVALLLLCILTLAVLVISMIKIVGE